MIDRFRPFQTFAQFLVFLKMSLGRKGRALALNMGGQALAGYVDQMLRDR